MFNRYLSIVMMLVPMLAAAQVQPIASARLQAPGTTITVRGIVSSGAELGRIRYLQDGTAGIAAYPGTGSAAGFEAAVGIGDSIEVTGILTDYQGLLEIAPISSYAVIVPNLPAPLPKKLGLLDISETFESQLLSFDCVVFADGGATFSDAGSYSVSDADGNTALVYLRSGHPLVGELVPGTPVQLTAILSEYNDFQLLPRTYADFSPTQCFYFTEQLTQSDIATDKFTLSWETNLSAVSQLHYGNTPSLGSTVAVNKDTTTQVFELNGLQPGTVYWVQVESVHNGNVILSNTLPFATRSLSSGQIKVYFNKPIDPAYAQGFSPEGQSAAAVIAETIARINEATQTLDVAMYNNGRADLTNALKEAHNRGVRVRYVAALDASNNALNPPPVFPVIFGNTDALMHDKFLVIDADLPDKAWVMSGSLNWTNQNINTDFNNTLFIQDQSLARTYEIEFEEMWGSETATPSLANSRFGPSKRDNTPHQFIIGGNKATSWFSPSDRTTDRIVETIRTATEEALFATFSFTKNEIGDALVDAYNNQVAVRGMIENTGDPGVEIDYLRSAGIDCRPHAISGDLHHKYGVFDAYAEDPIVVTGSHNWTFSAETANDENTLVLHDARLAALYKAEFEKRWQENAVSTTQAQPVVFQLRPNPVSENLSFLLGNEGLVDLEIRNLIGIPVFRAHDVANGQSIMVDQLPAGHYFAILSTKNERIALPFQKI